MRLILTHCEQIRRRGCFRLFVAPLHKVLDDEADFINFRRLHCDVLVNRYANCESDPTMQYRGALESARALVLAYDRRTKMLVRRQALTFEIIAGVARASICTTAFQRPTSLTLRPNT